VKVMGGPSFSPPISHLRVPWLHLCVDRRAAALTAPPILCVMMALVFRAAVALCGRTVGYSVAFGIYWLVWGLVAPMLLLGRPAVRGLYRDVHPRLGARPLFACSLLVLPILGGFVAASSRTRGS
jgi:hypothetical protein